MPERVREYELLEPLGKGGMGQIYRGRHVLLDSPCAVKVIRRELLADAELRARFLREALILRRLNASPFIVNCENVFEENEQLYLVMELLEGETLGARMKRLPPSWQRDRRILLQTVEAVAFAHQLGKGILHRDIKPSNIFILKDDAVKVLDFGLAKQLALEMEDVTATGQMIGTPAYMPPEVLKGDVNIRDVGPEGDVYALGVLAYRLFTGKLPYDLREDLSSLDALTRLTKAHLLGAALTPLVRLCPDLPSGLSAAVMAALEPDAARRPKDATELLKQLQEPLPTQATPASRQDEDDNSDQTLVINLPKFGEVGSTAQREAGAAKKPTPETQDKMQAVQRHGLTLGGKIGVCVIFVVLSFIFVNSYNSYRTTQANEAAKSDVKNAYTSSQALFSDTPLAEITSLKAVEEYDYKPTPGVNIDVYGTTATLLITAYHEKGSMFYMADSTGMITERKKRGINPTLEDLYLVLDPRTGKHVPVYELQEKSAPQKKEPGGVNLWEKVFGPEPVKEPMKGR